MVKYKRKSLFEYLKERSIPRQVTSARYVELWHLLTRRYFKYNALCVEVCLSNKACSPDSSLPEKLHVNQDYVSGGLSPHGYDFLKYLGGAFVNMET